MSSEETAVTLEEATDDDEDTPEQYKEKIRDIQTKTEEELEHIEGMPNPASESSGPDAPDDIRDITGEGISVTSPDWLSQGGQTIQSPAPTQRRPRNTSSLGEINLGELQDLLDQIDSPDGSIDPANLGQIGLDDASIDIDNLLSGIDLSEISSGDAGMIRLLSTIVQFQNNQFQVLEAMARLQLATAVGIADLIDVESPVSDITVSGSNVISDANTVEPVVPQSDQQSIPTKVLLLKADSRNTREIAIGDDQVDPTSGYIFQRGDKELLEIDLRGEELYMSSTEADQILHILGMV